MTRSFSHLVIVESPGKVKKIQAILGDAYLVRASAGHICDLPKKELGIDLSDGQFAETYEILTDKRRTVNDLKQLARQARTIYLATDPDREGEAIAWHIARHLPQTVRIARVSFQEITSEALRKAFEEPRRLHEYLIAAYRTRRVIDRLVGYAITPLLWEAGIASEGALSAGRVQTAALNMLVMREQERRGFQPRTYWTLLAHLLHRRGSFTAKLHTPGSIDRPEDLHRIVNDLASARLWWVAELLSGQEIQKAPAPFTTSTLHQEASKRLNLRPKQTNAAAQPLYEAGYITYIRTDSVHVAPEAQAAARRVIDARFGDAYLPEKPPTYLNSSTSAQEAHEAIRPTHIELIELPAEADLDEQARALYSLIWRRFVASQMNPAIYNIDEAYIHAGNVAENPLPYSFLARSRKLLFDGFRIVYTEAQDEDAEPEDSLTDLPPLGKLDPLQLQQLEPQEHTTKPPHRFTQARLIAHMERMGIGRPSTYAATIDVLLNRRYAEMHKHHLVPTVLGEQVLSFLLSHFRQLFDVNFTAQMEGFLDQVVLGELTRGHVLSAFYSQLAPALDVARAALKQRASSKDLGDLDSSQATRTCPECGNLLFLRDGRYGPFYGCSAYPGCKFTSPAESSRASAGGKRRARRKSHARKPEVTAQ